MDNLSYRESDDVLGVPYSRPTDDPTSHSYVDLKRDPDALAVIPEVQDEPALANLLRSLNASDSHFKSLGCACWYSDVEEANGKGQFGSYVAFMLDAWPFKDRRACEWMVGHFNDFGDTLEWTDGMKVMFELRPTILYEENTCGWSLELWAWGFGSDRETARAAWITIIERFGTFLGEDNERWREFLSLHPTEPPELAADGAEQVTQHG